MKKLYYGGIFNFNYQQAGYREQAAADNQAILLGSPDRLLQRSDGVIAVVPGSIRKRHYFPG